MIAYNKNVTRITIRNSKINIKGEVMYTVEELDDNVISSLIRNTNLHTIQTDEVLNDSAYSIIDIILEKRPDIEFRIYGGWSLKEYKIDLLYKLKNLNKLSLECNNIRDFSVLSKLDKLKSLRISVYDLKDYSYIKNVNEELTKLSLYMDVKSKSHNFDCEDLLRFKNLEELYLGKCRKNIELLSEMKKLKKLTLRGVKLKDYSFLSSCPIEKMSVHWTGCEGIETLRNILTIKELELWRIMKLDDISFVCDMDKLEILKLQDVPRIKKNINLAKFKNLKCLFINDIEQRININ